MISETAYSSKTKLIGQRLHVGEHEIGYSNLTPDPQGAFFVGGRESKFKFYQIKKLRQQKLSGMIKGLLKIESSPSEELGKTAGVLVMT